MDRALLLFDFDPAGSVLSTNANFLAAMGYASDEALTLRHDMLCDSMDEGIASAEQIWARLRRGEHFSGTCRYRRRNGGALWIEATYLPQINPAGEVERISVVSRKSIADAERQEEVRLLLLGINETGNAVAVSGPDGRIVYVNEGLSPHARLRPTRSIRSWANCWPAAGRMAARAKSWIAASPAARATTGRAGLRSRRQAAMGVCHGQLRVRRARHAGQRGGCADRYHPDQGA